MRMSFDIIGDIAIIDIPEGFSRKPSDAVREIRKTHPRVKTILLRKSERQGPFRLRRLKVLYGSETETVHKEHGFRFRVDPTKAFFSPRDSTERERIANQVRPKETVMVMFAGVGPFGIVIAGKQPKVAKVYMVEMNPDAFGYMKQNIAMNKMSDRVVPMLGDVTECCTPFAQRCDRVVMHLAMHAYQFLDVALSCLNDGGIIHFYAVGKHSKGLDMATKENEMFIGPINQLEDAVEKAGRKARIINKKRVAPYSPGGWKVCIDAEVSR